MNAGTTLFRIDHFSTFVGWFVALFSFLTVLYSLGFMRGKKGLGRYYAYIFLTFLASLGVVFANNLILCMVFWGFLGALLYLLTEYGGKERTSATAKKAFIIIGGTDAFMLLGVALVGRLAGSFDMDKVQLALDHRLAFWAYICLAVGAFAKAGVMPFHTWVPDIAEDAPTPVTAFLPASLDKLLGIYFLVRISFDIFSLNVSTQILLMAVGSVTIVAAVMMALIQHDFKRLLGYHAVSQVGYMVLGIGTGNPLGIAGALFHMLNNAVYKSCLFFSCGAVEQKAGTTDLDKLGGFAKVMPLNFAAFLIASLAISGIPPLNGFASKWMIYQGIIETGKTQGGLWIVWLAAAMLGSALTLASFMKLIHAVFLGQPAVNRHPPTDRRAEPAAVMLFPILLLAGLCVLFGIFAYQIPLKNFIFPSLNQEAGFSGTWESGSATLFILIGLLVGVLIYFLGTGFRPRETETFVGGEDIKQIPQMRLSGTEFYNTIQDIGILKFFYRLANEKVFDIYEVGTKMTFAFSKVLQRLHHGVLPTYLAWCLFGTALLLLFLVR